uniref:Mitochondrial import inner membrane translocase subunit Tim21 n=1 Tax=Nelumbo nucifera TaxID=4432 RepID=A0A822XDM0_NELNU|nr:TPA_asm: hypothetical protein HUJ06_019893 [Nelumbo nucifera]
MEMESFCSEVVAVQRMDYSVMEALVVEMALVAGICLSYPMFKVIASVGVAALAAYAVFKELIFEPKEYKIFGKALERVQNDSQVRVRIGSPVTGYGSESRNRSARQRIPNRTWTDEDGIEHVEVNFYIRGPHGAGKVFSEMFKDKVDRQWKFTCLIVEIKSRSPAQLMLESYVPA